MATDIRQTPFIKQLAANDRPTRERALLSLQTYLSSTRTLTPQSHLQLWKALFYTLWLTDRPAPQSQLCTNLSTLLPLLSSKNPTQLIPFVQAFWITMAREWTGIDVLRMEKFLLLVRRVLGMCFQVCRDVEYEEGLLEEIIRVIGEGPLNLKEGKEGTSMGLRYHVVDIYVDELERVGALEEKEGEAEDEVEVPLEKLLEPLRKLAKECATKMVRVKAKEALEDERLPGSGKKDEEQEAEEDDDSDGWGGFDD